MATRQAGDAVGERLERLRRATDRISPSEGFERRVLAAVVARRSVRGPLAAVVPFGSRALVVALVAAAAAVMAVYQTETQNDDDVVVASDSGWWVP